MTARLALAGIIAILLGVIAAVMIADIVNAYGNPQPDPWPQLHRMVCDPDPCRIQVVHPEDLDR